MAFAYDKNFDDNLYKFSDLKKKPDNFSIKNEKDVKYNEIENFVFINSNNRDSSKYPLHYDYKIDLINTFRNIKKIEIVSVVFPNSTNIYNEPVLFFDIEELNYIEIPSSSGSMKIFAAIPLEISNQTSGGFISIKGINEKNSTRLIYRSPIASITRLSIRIRDIDGNLYNFGSPSGSMLKKDQHSFILKITTEEKTRMSLQERNVF